MLSFRLKMLCSAILIVVLLVCMPVLVSAENDNITVIVDGTELVFDVSPVVINQRTMVLMRAIFEYLGADIEWIPEENAVRATTKTLDLYLQLGNSEMIVNGQSQTLDVAPCAINNRTLVPLRAVSEAFSATVNWEGSTSTVSIHTPNEKYAAAYDKTLNEEFDAKHIRTSYSDVEYFEMEIIGSKLKVTCLTTDERMKSFGVRINNAGTLVKTKDVTTGKKCYLIINLDEVSIPSHSVLEIYTKNKGEDTYHSYVYRCLYLDKIGSSYEFSKSLMLEHNQQMLSEWVDPKTYLNDNIPEAVVELSNSICAGVNDDYQKLLLIHDWVAENLYYDMDDYYNKGTHSFAGVEDLLVSKHSVCQGYADLITLLVRAQGIPCRQIVGYALGLSAKGYWTEENITRDTSNHAWNQAYIDHRWVNIDATWDSDNVYENGKYVYGGIDYHLYFDISNVFLSYSHKILSISEE